MVSPAWQVDFFLPVNHPGNPWWSFDWHFPVFEPVFPCFYISLNSASQFICCNGLQASLRFTNPVSITHLRWILKGR